MKALVLLVGVCYLTLSLADTPHSAPLTPDKLIDTSLISQIYSKKSVSVDTPWYLHLTQYDRYTCRVENDRDFNACADQCRKDYGDENSRNYDVDKENECIHECTARYKRRQDECKNIG
jgi:hypothetical protein